MKKIMILICLLFILNGCYDNQELNNLAIITAMNISKNNDKYNITIQVINPKNRQDETSSNDAKYLTYEATGEKISTTINKINKKTPKKLYESQMQILLIDKLIAKENIKEIIDYFIRNNDTRSEFYVLINKNNTLNPLKITSSNNIVKTLKKNHKYISTVTPITLNDLITDYQNKNKEITLPTIDINKKDIIISNIAIFKKNKLIGYLNDEESLTYNFIVNKINNTIVTTNYKKENYIITEITKSKTKIKIKPNKKIKIIIKGNALIKEKNNKIETDDKYNKEKLEKIINKKLEKKITKNFNKINKEYNTDIYGFKDLLYKYYKKRVTNNEGFLKNIDINIKCKLNIINDDNLIGGISNE
ncbi:MAG: Ger(x)C family spore germination protein [Bacilli bacterium]|nr:Ger(x)C family spore germination protein [Bacilli bacterium]